MRNKCKLIIKMARRRSFEIDYPSQGLVSSRSENQEHRSDTFATRRRSIDEYKRGFSSEMTENDEDQERVDNDVNLKEDQYANYKLKMKAGENDCDAEHRTNNLVYIKGKIGSSSGDVIADIYCCHRDLERGRMNSESSLGSPLNSVALRKILRSPRYVRDDQKGRSRRKESSSSSASSSPVVYRSKSRTHSPHVYHASPTRSSATASPEVANRFIDAFRELASSSASRRTATSQGEHVSSGAATARMNADREAIANYEMDIAALPYSQQVRVK